MKKLVNLAGKNYLLDEETKSLEEVEVVEETTPTEEPKKEEETTEETVEEISAQIAKSLGLDEIKAKIEAFTKSNEPQKSTSLVNFEKLMKKSVDEMTSREKILGFFQGLMQNNTEVLKALSEGTPADGGFLIPEDFRAEVIRDIADKPHLRNEVTVIPMKRDSMKVPSLVSGVTVTWTAENAEKSTTSAEFGSKSIEVKKMAAILYSSDELIEDSTEIDVVNFIIGLFSEAIGNEEDAVITAGNGTTQPQGYSVVGTGIISDTYNTAPTFDDIIDLTYDLPQKYHANAKFYMPRTMIAGLRKLKDDYGRYLWAEPVAAGMPPTLSGYAVVEDNNLPTGYIGFGDLKKTYWLGDRKKMSVKISNDTETAFTHDQTAIRVVERIGGRVVLPEAFRILKKA